MKEGKAGHEINGGGDSGNNVVEKFGDRGEGDSMAEMMYYVQHQVEKEGHAGHCIREIEED